MARFSNSSSKTFLSTERINKVFKEYETKLGETKVDQFMSTLGFQRKGTQKKYWTRIQIFSEVMESRPTPNTGTKLIKLCVATLKKILPKIRKKRYIDTWCDILTYGIKRHSMNDKRWQPPEVDYRKELKGISKKI